MAQKSSRLEEGGEHKINASTLVYLPVHVSKVQLYTKTNSSAFSTVGRFVFYLLFIFTRAFICANFTVSD